jgi:hypothetical protein
LAAIEAAELSITRAGVPNDSPWPGVIIAIFAEKAEKSHRYRPEMGTQLHFTRVGGFCDTLAPGSLEVRRHAERPQAC